MALHEMAAQKTAIHANIKDTYIHMVSKITRYNEQMVTRRSIEAK